MEHYNTKALWTKGRNNWNRVCNIGLALGALAIADEAPKLADRIMRYALESLLHINHVYEPEGAYPEGPSHWEYGTRLPLPDAQCVAYGIGSRFRYCGPGGDRAHRFVSHPHPKSGGQLLQLRGWGNGFSSDRHHVRTGPALRSPLLQLVESPAAGSQIQA